MRQGPGLGALFVFRTGGGGPRADCKPGSIRVNSVFGCEYETTSNDTA